MSEHLRSGPPLDAAPVWPYFFGGSRRMMPSSLVRSTMAAPSAARFTAAIPFLASAFVGYDSPDATISPLRAFSRNVEFSHPDGVTQPKWFDQDEIRPRS